MHRSWIKALCSGETSLVPIPIPAPTARSTHLSSAWGQTDIGCAMASGTSWFKVPQAIKVNLTGKLPKYVKGKDIILTIIGMIGVDGARYPIFGIHW